MALNKATPKEIPKIIPDLLVRVRMIWDRCEYYQNNEKICNLLKKISNEIIKRCISNINVKDMFDGDVELCMQQLNDSIYLCNEWFNIFKNFKEIVNEDAEDDEDKMWTF